MKNKKYFKKRILLNRIGLITIYVCIVFCLSYEPIKTLIKRNMLIEKLQVDSSQLATIKELWLLIIQLKDEINELDNKINSASSASEEIDYKSQQSKKKEELVQKEEVFNMLLSLYIVT